MLKNKITRLAYIFETKINALFQRQILSVKAVIFNKNGEILMVRHSYKGANKWYLPGGKARYGERPDIALMRELKEEINLKIREAALVGIYVGQNKSLAFLFVCGTNHDNLSVVVNKWSEIEEADFFPINKLPLNICAGVIEKIKTVELYLEQKKKEIVWGMWVK